MPADHLIPTNFGWLVAGSKGVFHVTDPSPIKLLDPPDNTTKAVILATDFVDATNGLHVLWSTGVLNEYQVAGNEAEIKLILRSSVTIPNNICSDWYELVVYPNVLGRKVTVAVGKDRGMFHKINEGEWTRCKNTFGGIITNRNEILCVSDRLRCRRLTEENLAKALEDPAPLDKTPEDLELKDSHDDWMVCDGVAVSRESRIVVQKLTSGKFKTCSLDSEFESVTFDVPKGDIGRFFFDRSAKTLIVPYNRATVGIFDPITGHNIKTYEWDKKRSSSSKTTTYSHLIDMSRDNMTCGILLSEGRQKKKKLLVFDMDN
jgi:hypothetical protein